MNDAVFTGNTCRSCDFEQAKLLNVDIRNTNFTDSRFSEEGYFIWNYAPPHPICGITDINGRRQTPVATNTKERWPTSHFLYVIYTKEEVA